MSLTKLLAFGVGIAAAGLGAGLVRPDLPVAGPLAASVRAALRPAPGGSDGRPASEVRYQYVDGAGAVRFVRTLEEVPAGQRATAGRVEIGGPPPASAAAAPPAGAAPAARRFASVELYTASWCPHCRDAIADLSARGVAFRVREIDTDIDAKAELKERSGDLSVPQLYLDGRRALVGYSAPGYESVFGAAR